MKAPTLKAVRASEDTDDEMAAGCSNLFYPSIDKPLAQIEKKQKLF